MVTSTLVLTDPSIEWQFMLDSDWMENLMSYISGLIDLHVNHIRLWLDSNLKQFQASHATVEDLWRQFDNMAIEMRVNAQFCSTHCSPASPLILACVSHIDSYYQDLFCSLLSTLPSISQLMLGLLTHRLGLL